MDGNRSNLAGGKPRVSYRFALRPKWILSHLFVVALVVLMINLGFWQLRRLDQRRARGEAPIQGPDAQFGSARDLLERGRDPVLGDDLTRRSEQATAVAFGIAAERRPRFCR